MVTPSKTKAQRRAPSGPRRSGRPTSEETARLSDAVREAALALFLERGYEGTTLDAIADAAGTTKPSLYGRFNDKDSLFDSVVRWATERADWPVSEPPAPDLNDLEGALRAIAQAAVRRATHPEMVGLTRLAAAQAERFPELAERTNATSWPRKKLVVELLRRHAASGAIVADEPEVLAEIFLGMVSALPARLASFGIVRSPSTQAHHTRLAVDVFLRALRPD